MSPAWLILWSVLFSLSWMLPVHIPPWSTFPADAWGASISALAAVALLLRVRKALEWSALTCLVFALMFLPWAQFSARLLPFAGQAWISSAYLLGLLLAIFAGSRWEGAAPGQLTKGLFVAIGIAAFVSVGLQIYTWLGLSGGGALGVLVADPAGNRPSANLGQPNQLATLLVWGLLAFLWAYLNGHLAGASAAFAACFLLLGLSMTQSRTGWLALTCVMVALWLWRRLWPSRWLPWVATALYLLFLAFTPMLQWLEGALLLGQEATGFRIQQQEEMRLSAWRLFLHAVAERPWFGYGWSETNAAQMEVAGRLPALGSIFSHSHNLFLDLILWCGIPIGGVIIYLLGQWFWSRGRAVGERNDAVLMMLLGAVAIHALVEFPLQYAYFLLPAGLVMGIVNVRLRVPVFCETPGWTFAALCLAGILALGVTLRDYARVEVSYGLLRLEQSLVGQGRPPMGEAPDVWVLTQLREWIKMSRQKARAGMTGQELKEMETMARSFPSLSTGYRLATALALNDRPEDAREWLQRTCKFSTEKECWLAQRDWKEESAKDSRIAGIKWPTNQ